MKRQINVRLSTQPIFVEFPQTSLRQRKILLRGELHPMKSDGFVFNYATAALVAHGQ